MLTIAGVAVRSRSSYPLLREENRAYAQFQAADAASAAVEPAIDTEVLLTPAPENHAPPIFDSDISWWMQPESDGYRISFRGKAVDRPHTVMCSDRATSRVQVYAEQLAPAPDLSTAVTDPLHYPLDQILLMNHLALRGGVICHAAAAALEGGALLFAGVSRAGKTTMSRLFRKAGLGQTLLSDDRVILRTGEDEAGRTTVTAWGTPWPGEAQIAENRSAPLAAVLFLTKAPVDEIVPIPPNVAMRRLMPVTSSPWYDRERLPGVLETCARIAESVPSYELRFTLRGDIVSLLIARDWSRS